MCVGAGPSCVSALRYPAGQLVLRGTRKAQCKGRVQHEPLEVCFPPAHKQQGEADKAGREPSQKHEQAGREGEITPNPSPHAPLPLAPANGRPACSASACSQSPAPSPPDSRERLLGFLSEKCVGGVKSLVSARLGRCGCRQLQGGGASSAQPGLARFSASGDPPLLGEGRLAGTLQKRS